jgi:hypothetical protein
MMHGQPNIKRKVFFSDELIINNLLSLFTADVLQVQAEIKPNPLAVRSKSSVDDHLITGTAGPNAADGMDVCLLWLLCVLYVVASATS